MLSGPRNGTVGMLSGLRNESVDELTQQHASHAVAGGTRSWRSARGARASRGVIRTDARVRNVRNSSINSSTTL